MPPIPFLAASGPSLRHHLDELASWVDARLESGAEVDAWRVTLALEALRDHRDTGTCEDRPPAPVIGRRFAAAHRALLTGPAPQPRACRDRSVA